MIRILFVCHGNICRSPMAEFIFKKMAGEDGKSGSFSVASAATSSEELGNPVYLPVRKLLNRKDIDCSGKTARRITAADYENYDLIIGMDRANLSNLLHFFNNDPDGKIHNLLDYTGRKGEEVADPWYTGDFETAYNDIYTGCRALYGQLVQTAGGDAKEISQNEINKKNSPVTGMMLPEAAVILDFSEAVCKSDVFEELSKKLPWEEWYGKNLDALWDILTGMPGTADVYEIILPPEERTINGYASAVAEVFREAGKTVR